MKQTALLKAVAVGIAVLCLAPAAFAQATRTWVSGVGDDANPCSRTAPCKTFAGAISKTADNGVIDVLDPGGFGAVTITKNITIDGSGGSIAGILVSGTNGINVNGSGIHVILRNLDIEGVGTGLTGVNFVNGATLTIENCRIYGFQAGSATGILAALNGSAQLMVKDTVIRDAATGVFLTTTAGQLLVTMDNVTIESTSGYGVQSAGNGTVYAVIKRSTINNNAQHAVYAGGASSVINVFDSSLSFNNGSAVNAAVPGARIRISGNAILNNAYGIVITAGATVESDATNRIAGFNASATPNGTLTNH